VVKLVVDSSVVIKWYVAESLSTEARTVLDAYKNGSLTLIAPDLLNAEIGNILWKKETLQGFDPADARQVLDRFRLLPLIFASSADLLEEAYKIATTYKRSVYDSLYLALSVREHCEFVTADERLVNAVDNALFHVVWLPASKPPA
jgi:predicted nucleic acid-binding protein